MIQADGSDWHDPENQAPDGRGCSLCHVGRPVVWTNKRGLCAECVCRWFQGWASEDAIDWILRQIERNRQWKAWAKKRKLANRESLGRWLHGS